MLTGLLVTPFDFLFFFYPSALSSLRNPYKGSNTFHFVNFQGDGSSRVRLSSQGKKKPQLVGDL